MLTFNTILVMVWLLVLNSKLDRFLNKEADLTLTFDPSTLTFAQLQALSDGNFMCEYDQNPWPCLSALSPQISLNSSYQTLLGLAQVGSCPRKQWQIRKLRVLAYKWNQISQNFLQRFVKSMITGCQAVIAVNWKKKVFTGIMLRANSCDFLFWPPARFGGCQKSNHKPALFQIPWKCWEMIILSIKIGLV